MNGYLVVARLSCDDIPLRLFAMYEDAHAWANCCSEKDAVSKNEIMFADLRSYATCIGIVEFIGGLPQRFKMVQDFG